MQATATRLMEMVISMTNRITKIQSAVLDEENGLVALTLAQEDGSEVLLELQPSLLTELVGLVGMATEILSEETQSPLQEDLIHIVGVAASATTDRSAIRLRFADKDGFLHHFEADDARCASLRFQLRRAIEVVRKAKAEPGFANTVVSPVPTENNE